MVFRPSVPKTRNNPPLESPTILRGAIMDPRDGHGARSWHDVIILQMFREAMKGDEAALVGLLHEIASDHQRSKKKRKTSPDNDLEWIEDQYAMRPLAPVMEVLGMITITNTVDEHSGKAADRVTLTDWFAEFVSLLSEVDQQCLEEVRTWLNTGGHQFYEQPEVWD